MTIHTFNVTRHELFDYQITRTYFNLEQESRASAVGLLERGLTHTALRAGGRAAGAPSLHPHELMHSLYLQVLPRRPEAVTVSTEEKPQSRCSRVQTTQTDSKCRHTV